MGRGELVYIREMEVPKAQESEQLAAVPGATMARVGATTKAVLFSLFSDIFFFLLSLRAC